MIWNSVACRLTSPGGAASDGTGLAGFLGDGGHLMCLLRLGFRLRTRERVQAGDAQKRGEDFPHDGPWCVITAGNVSPV